KIDADLGPAKAKPSQLGEVVGHVDLAAHRTISTRAGGGIEYGDHARRSRVPISKREGRRPGVHVVSVADSGAGPLPASGRPATRGKKVVTSVVGKKERRQTGRPQPQPVGRRRHKRRRKRSEVLAEVARTEVIDLSGAEGETTRTVAWDEEATVGDLAKAMEVPVNDVIMKLMGMGVMASVNQTVDRDTAALLAAEYGCALTVRVEEEPEPEPLPLEEEIPEEELEPRPPVVTVMGHVDHGKTTLLDYLRHTHVTAGEAGGITQHIGAYQVHLDHGAITFLDTPGHEAFTAIRARGAQVTDLVILVVAADDGVMPQTVEAINHAKAAGVPIVVAVNKIDLPEANPDRVKQELTEHGLVAEEYGGDVPMVPISAKTGDGVDELLEMVFLQAELLELKASPKATCRGVVIEAKVDKGRGPVATVLVQQGTLKKGDACVVGQQYGRVRTMLDDRGKPVKSAGPATPVEVVGLAGVPEPGDDLVVMKNEREARALAEQRAERKRQLDLSRVGRKSTLEELLAAAEGQETKVLPVIIKGDVQGSVEAVSDTLQRISTEKVKLDVIHAAVGAVTETDVDLAKASGAIIIGFNVRPTPSARKLAEQEHIDIRLHSIIYKLAEEIREAMEGLLEATYEEKVIGRAEVREVFHISKVGNIAGCYVLDGVVKRNAEARLLRDDAVVHTGRIASLRRFKEDAKEVAAGFECGVGLAGYNDIKPGDIIEVFELEEVAAKL
ncbi:MAG: translation initiation factor IF-2, partial [Nitrospirae bacterium]